MASAVVSSRRFDKAGQIGLRTRATAWAYAMSSLENKIPPPVVFLVVAIAMWLAAWPSPAIDIAETLRLTVAILLAAFGVAMAFLGLKAFGEAKTTVNPVNIDAASSLVTTGVYQYTRNPMYLGLTSLLIAWALYLAVPITLLGPVAFVLYITRFQIVPEERVLSRIFGQTYDDYRARVRRWL
jgi:protein-S-isoprenylcysteine O-methyltransferase Ste14